MDVSCSNKKSTLSQCIPSNNPNYLKNCTLYAFEDLMIFPNIKIDFIFDEENNLSYFFLPDYDIEIKNPLFGERIFIYNPRSNHVDSFWIKFSSFDSQSKSFSFLISDPSKPESFCINSSSSSYSTIKFGSSWGHSKLCFIYENQSIEEIFYNLSEEKLENSSIIKYSLTIKNESTHFFKPSYHLHLYDFGNGEIVQFSSLINRSPFGIEKMIGLKIGFLDFENYLQNCQSWCFSDIENLDFVYVFKNFWKRSNLNFYIEKHQLNINKKPFFGYGFWYPASIDFIKKKVPYNNLFPLFNFLYIKGKLNSNSLFFFDLTNFGEGLSSDFIGILFNSFRVFEKNNPSVNKAYYIADEPGWNGQSVEEVNEKYDLVDKYDSGALKWTNFACADTQDSLEHYISTLKDYGMRADIISLDYYADNGVPADIRVIDNPTVSGIGEYVDILRDTFEKEGKVIWFIAQGFSRKSVSEEVNKWVLKFGPYQAIVHGAKGISFYGFHYKDYPSFNFGGKEIDKAARPDIIFPILKELKESEEFLAENPIKRVIAPVDEKYNLIGSFDGIEYSVFKKGSEIRIVLVNRYNYSVEKSFDSMSFGIKPPKIELLTEWKYLFPEDGVYNSEEDLILDQKEISLDEEGSFNLHFEPYQVYLLKGKLPNNSIGDISQNFIEWISNFFGF
ncbi:hypothetical protein COX98_02755 [Candidatus Pacearchaeota archaeon CG_4_10_14_0_2_um_filter_30_11]|nr:MAG: hypothetical protein COX98_02755 [Candidatus Pacearchaeota archaeon CG_4_10_14_0_2_um_filter_30_11]